MRSRPRRPLRPRLVSLGLLVLVGGPAFADTGAGGDLEIARILDPSDVQYTELPGGDSPRVGEAVAVRGVVLATAPNGRFWYLADPAGGEWSGLKVEGPSLDRTPGERVIVTGIVRESAGETRLEQTGVRARGTAPLPGPTPIGVIDLLGDAERWEGVLVRVDDVTVEGETSRYGEFPIGDGVGTGALVDDEFVTSYIAEFGDTFESITGVVAWGFGDFQLEPRSDADLVGWTSVRNFDSEVRILATDGSGTPLPVKVTFFPTSGSGLDLGPEDRAEGSEDAAFLPAGGGTVRVPSDEYDVVVSRGIEYGIFSARVLAPSGGGVDVVATLEREVDTTGWISGDFHLHAAPSFDTPLPVPGRVLSLAAEGVEWAIATDHNAVTDYAPVIADLGLGDWMRSSIGDEITTYSPSFGHFNSWPLEAGSAPVPWEGRTPAALFASARTDPGTEIVQVNHPRISGSDTQYFDAYDVSRFTGEPGLPGFSFDFDALEGFNGRYLDQGIATLETWMRMLNDGRRITLTGNSDSHHLVFREPGYPRNFVASPTDEPALAREDDLVDAVLGGRSFLSYGPILDFTANGHGLGATGAVDAGGEVALRARVQWASWMDVSSGTIWANGREIETFVVEGGAGAAGGPGDVTLEWTHRPDVDTWYVVMVEGSGDLAPVRRGLDFRPLAVANPIWIDADGDGQFTPPGNVADALTVAELDQVDANGVPVRIGDWVSVEGRATTDTRFLDPASGIFYLDDGTGGVQVREMPGSISEVRRGHRVWVGGFVTQSLGETVVSDALVEILGDDPGAEPQSPRSTGDVVADGEPWEGRVVRLAGLNVTSGSWPVGGAEGALVVDDGTGPAPLVVPTGVVVPAEAADLVDFETTAIVTQRDFSSPYLSGYRLTLRSGDDLFPDSEATGAGRSGAGEGPRFGRPRPNPFRSSLAIAYRVPASSPPPRAEIVNVTGRIVRSLTGPTSGPGEIRWDGRDRDGSAVAAGVYFVRLRAEDLSRIVRVVKLD